jgi:hypothetical protein
LTSSTTVHKFHRRESGLAFASPCLDELSHLGVQQDLEIFPTYEFGTQVRCCRTVSLATIDGRRSPAFVVSYE